LTALLSAVMVAQSELGLLLRDQYQDVAWIKASWLGNDWVTLVVAVPLLAFGFTRAASGSTRGLLLWLGMLAYAFYNYSYYLFGAALNVFFPLYVFAVLLSAAGLLAGLSRLDAHVLAMHFRPATPVHIAGVYLMSVGSVLAAIWLGFWAGHVFFGAPTPIEPEAFKLVAALNTTLIAPALVTAGLLLMQRRAWGYIIACLTGVQASLYLLVLATNALLSVWYGLVEWPGEIAIWGPLALSMAAVTSWLFANAGGLSPEV
jgi:hypothetical protein